VHNHTSCPDPSIALLLCFIFITTGFICPWCLHSNNTFLCTFDENHGESWRSESNKKESRLSAVSDILLTVACSWEQVASQYKEKSGKAELWNKDDVKRHWSKKCATQEAHWKTRVHKQFQSEIPESAATNSAEV
jgi:hypothetical protein